jgi:hypothetical protein
MLSLRLNDKQKPGMPDKTGLLSQLLRTGRTGRTGGAGAAGGADGGGTARPVQVAIRYTDCHVLLVEWSSNTYWMCGWCRIALVEKPR